MRHQAPDPAPAAHHMAPHELEFTTPEIQPGAMADVEESDGEKDIQCTADLSITGLVEESISTAQASPNITAPDCVSTANHDLASSFPDSPAPQVTPSDSTLTSPTCSPSTTHYDGAAYVVVGTFILRAKSSQVLRAFHTPSTDPRCPLGVLEQIDPEHQARTKIVSQAQKITDYLEAGDETAENIIPFALYLLWRFRCAVAKPHKSIFQQMIVAAIIVADKCLSPEPQTLKFWASVTKETVPALHNAEILLMEGLENDVHVSDTEMANFEYRLGMVWSWIEKQGAAEGISRGRVLKIRTWRRIEAEAADYKEWAKAWEKKWMAELEEAKEKMKRKRDPEVDALDDCRDGKRMRR